MAEQFKVGDVVKLKSGGPKMTVTQIGEDMSGTMTIWCVWFDGTARIEGTFPFGTVELVPSG
jgi:uncharacterized protein YodC (DUF2158 family)